MLNYSEEEKRIIRTYSSHKDLTITFLDDDNFAPIKGDRIYWESLKLTESLCDSENLIFGSCESSEMQIQVADVLFEIKNHEIRLDLTVDEIPVPLGIFFIANVERATDKRYKILTCYDRMYYMQMDVIEWYNSLFPTVDTAVTLKQLRDSFFAWMGIEQENTNLVNDNIIVRKTIDAEELSGIQVIEGICEINGAFGHINRYGVFEYKYLDNTAIYPSETLYPRNDLYPGGGESQEITNANYIPPSEYSDYMVRGINKLRVGEGENNIGATVTSKNYIEDEENSYIVNSNFLIYGNNAEELESIANNLGTKIFGITYTPNSTNLVAIPYIEVGDAFHVSSAKTPFVSFVLKRTLSGIQAMQDLWEAKGEEFQPDIATGSNRDIIQLRSRVNSLTRTVDETASEIKSVEAELSGDITTLDSKITQNASSITAEVTRATTAEGNLSTRVEITESGLLSKVDKNGVISSINQTSENITINANKIDLQGYVTFSGLEDGGYVTNSDLSESGKTTINGANITTGKISANYIDGTNLKVGGKGQNNATIQVGASGVENDNFLYMVGYDDYMLAETHLDCKAVTCYGTDGYGFSVNRKGMSFIQNENVYFTILKDEGTGITSIGSTISDVAIISTNTYVNSVNAFGPYTFATGGRIYKDAGDRIAIGDKNVFVENLLSCQKGIEIGVNENLVMYGGNIEGAYVSECKVAFNDKNGVPHFDKKLTEIISELYQLI